MRFGARIGATGLHELRLAKSSQHFSQLFFARWCRQMTSRCALMHVAVRQGSGRRNLSAITTCAREIFGLSSPEDATQQRVMRMNEVHSSGVAAEATLNEPFIGKREVARRLGKKGEGRSGTVMWGGCGAGRVLVPGIKLGPAAYVRKACSLPLSLP